MQLPELLAPGGNLEKAKIALLYGADAVYIGGSNYGLRAQAGNFTLAEMATLLQFAHQQGKKVYVTVNIYAQNRHFHDLSVYLQQLADLQVDGILISDPGIFALAKKIAPTLPLHISTQANIQNTGAAAFWAQAGASRVVLGREVGGEDIAAICHGCNAEIEVFVHGAMCMAYSGRCLLSSYFKMCIRDRHVAYLVMLGGAVGMTAGIMKEKASHGILNGIGKMELGKDLTDFTEKTGKTMIKAGKVISRIGK